jgi:hypothetical protein
MKLKDVYDSITTFVTQVFSESSELSDEDLDTIGEQCGAFYTAR